ncbi:tudor domain-containing protein 1-like [Anopheles albimanus]|uniref:Tudor domain-containing protein n=1 Tax=Anopheles albimanus TaxID=7167 RepID=A0A8W7JZS9_ANOAL|nr:tudor domain-containing protein 1-like [Anopheles albimanus]
MDKVSSSGSSDNIKMENDKHIQLWETSVEFLAKQIRFAQVIQQAMLAKTKRIGRTVFSEKDTVCNKLIRERFQSAHQELLQMSKSVQSFVCDWQMLLIDDTEEFDGEPNANSQTSTIEADPDFIKPITNYEPDQIVELLVTCVSETQPGSFYALDVAEERVLSLFSAMQENVDHSLQRIPVSAGKVFIVMLDGLWFRAVRIAASPVGINGGRNECFALYLIDTGETFPYDENLKIAQVPASFHDVPAAAIKCVLASEPTDSESLGNCKRQSFRVVRVESNDVLRVRLVEKTVTTDARNPLQNPSEEELKVWNSLPESTTNATKAILGYVPQDDVKICKYYNPQTKQCFKGSNCRQRHVELDEHGWTLDRDEVPIEVRAQMEMPALASLVKLMPTFVVDVDFFYAHVIPDNGGDCSIIAQLLHDMNSPDTVAQYKIFRRMPCLGELVLAMFEEAWYRAKVVEVFEETVTVFYVDYGNAATVDLSELRVWNKSFSYVPDQAVICQIANACSVKPGHIEAIEQLQKVLLDKEIDALIIDNKTPWQVQIFDEDGFDIGEGLILTHLALPRQPVKSKEDTPMPG